MAQEFNLFIGASHHKMFTSLATKYVAGLLFMQSETLGGLQSQQLLEPDGLQLGYITANLGY